MVTDPLTEARAVELTVVVPVFRCAQTLPSLHERLSRSADEIAGQVEFVFIDDRSDDGAWDVLRAIARRDARVRAIRFSRNFGQHIAITAGLREAHGRFAVVMDCDLQHRPEEIPRLYATALGGYDIVLARRRGRQHPWPRRLATRAYFGLMNVFLGTRFEGEYDSFSIVGRKVIDSFLRVGDRSRHYLLVLHWLGYRTTSIDVQHQARRGSVSSYTLAALIEHAIDGVFFQTTALLRWIVYLGFVLAVAGIVGAIFLAVRSISGAPVPDWSGLAALILVTGGFIILSTGITGLYIGKIFDQARDRPLYVVDDRLGAPAS